MCRSNICSTLLAIFSKLTKRYNQHNPNMTTKITQNRPLLPSVASILHEDNNLKFNKTQSEPTSPLFDTTTLKNNFKSDGSGIIRLPPLNINRPKSVESALRHTVSLPNILNNNTSNEPLVTLTKTPKVLSTNPNRKHVLTPITPMVENKLKDLQNTVPRSNTNVTVEDQELPISSPFTAVTKAILTPSSNEKKRAFAFITHSKDTFGVKEPKIDNAPLARRKRRRTSTQELNILQDSFNKCITPSRKEKIILAQRCNMSEKAVQIWFQNKRQALKRHKLNQSTPINKSSIKEQDLGSNPIKDPTIPQLEIPMDISLDATPTKKSPNKQIIKRDNSTSSSSSSSSPTSNNNNLKGGQSLTFHIRNDQKSLTPIKTSPKNKVNKLINDFKQTKNTSNENIENLIDTPIQSSSPIKNQQFHTFTVSPKKKSIKLQFKPVEMKLPLKEIDTNIFHQSS